MLCFRKQLGIIRCNFRNLTRNFSKKAEPEKKAETCKKSKKGGLEVCTISDCMIDPSKPEPSVVIVGAGIAGLSAAQRLVQRGISNFTILEATDR